MKKRATSRKYRESIANVLKGAQLIIQEVLTNSRVMTNSTSRLTNSRLQKQIMSSVCCCFSAVEPHVAFITYEL